MSFKQQAIILGLLVLSFGVGAQALAADSVMTCTKTSGVSTEILAPGKSVVGFYDDVKVLAKKCLDAADFQSVAFDFNYQTSGVTIKGAKTFPQPTNVGAISVWAYSQAPTSVRLDTNMCRCTANNLTTVQKISIDTKVPENVYKSIEKFSNTCKAKTNFYRLECSIDYTSTTSPVLKYSPDTTLISNSSAEVDVMLAALKLALVTPPVQGGVDPGTVTGGDKDAGTVVGGDSGTKAADDGSLVPPGCRGDAPLDTCGLSQIEDLIVRVIKLILGLSGSLALLMFVYGGTLYIMAGGVPSMAGKGKSAMTNAVIGLILVLCARLILSSILRALVTG